MSPIYGIIAQDNLVPAAPSLPPPATKFVAVGWTIGPINPYIISSEDGVTWIERDPDPGSGNSLYGIAYDPGTDRWVACSDGNTFYYSDDAAVTWTPVTPTFSGGSASFFGICWTGTRFVSVGQYATLPAVAVSADGVTWTEKTSAPNTAGNWERCAGISGLAIAGGTNSGTTTPRIMSSADDGNTWTSRTPASAASTDVMDIAIKTAGGTIAAAVASGAGSTATRVTSSTDGTTWTARTSDPANGVYWNGVTWNDTVFCAIGVDISTGSIPKVMTSANGTSWTARTATPSSAFYPLGIGGAGDGSMVAVGVEDGFNDPRMMLSANDGVTWTQVFPPTTTFVNLRHVAGNPNITA